MPKYSTRPVALRVHDTTLSCTVRRVIGYEAYCACGATFPTRKEWSEARRDGIEHRAAEHRAARRSLEVPHTERAAPE